MDHQDTIPEQPLAQLEEACCSFIDHSMGRTASPLCDRLKNASEQGSELESLARQLGRRYRHCTLGNFDQYDPEKQGPVLEVARDFAENMADRIGDGSGLVLFGRHGNGKDHIAAALLKIAVAKHRLRVLRYDGGTLFNEIHEAIKDDWFGDLYERLLRPHVLCISDPVPPAGGLTDSQLRRFRDIIDGRYRQMRSTWLTMNIDRREDAQAAFSAPTVDRVKENALSIFCDWESHRERRGGDNGQA